MKCSILKHKSAKDNTKQFIAEVGGLKSFNSNEIADYKIFMDATKQLEQQSIRSYGVSGRPWLADDNGFTAVPNYRVLRQIDNVRKRMGLYEDKLAVGAKPSEVVKLKQEKTTVVSEPQSVDTNKLNQIQQIFEDNPDFSSKIYEALGFKQFKFESLSKYSNLSDSTLNKKEEAVAFLQSLDGKKLFSPSEMLSRISNADTSRINKGLSDYLNSILEQYQGIYAEESINPYRIEFKEYLKLGDDRDDTIGDLRGYNKAGYKAINLTNAESNNLIKTILHEFVHDIEPYVLFKESKLIKFTKTKGSNTPLTEEELKIGNQLENLRKLVIKHLAEEFKNKKPDSLKNEIERLENGGLITIYGELKKPTLVYINNLKDELNTVNRLIETNKVEEFIENNKNFFLNSEYNHYGVTNLNEFITEALTNDKFRNLLNEIPYKNTTILSYLFELFQKILGIKKDTVLSEALNLIHELATTKRGQLRDFQPTPQQKQQATLLYSQYLDSLNKPNTNPILQGNQQEQLKKFVELQERLNNKEFLEGAKSAYESTPALQELGTQEEYNDYIARVSVGIIKNPSSGEYNYISQVKDIVYHGSYAKNLIRFDKQVEGRTSLTGFLPKGFYFTNQQYVASTYTAPIDVYDKAVWSSLVNFIEGIKDEESGEYIQEPESFEKLLSYIGKSNNEKEFIIDYRDGKLEDSFGGAAEAGLFLPSKENTELYLKLIKNKDLEGIKKKRDEYLSEEGNIYPSILNIKTPLYKKSATGSITTINLEGRTAGEQKITLDKELKNSDGLIISNIRDSSDYRSSKGIKYNENIDEQTYVVFEPEQIHILGGKQDVEQFKTYINKLNQIQLSAKPSDRIVGTRIAVDTTMQERLFGGKEVTSTADALSRIPKDHPLKPLANKLAKLSPVAPVKYVAVAPLGETALAYYDPNTNEIVMYGNVLYDKGDSTATFLHEVIHELTYKALRDPLNQDLINEFDRLRKEAQSKLGTRNSYFTESLDEFITGVFTKSTFIKDLMELESTQPTKFKNLWEEVWHHILSIFKIGKKSTLYDQAFAVATNILETRNKNWEGLEEPVESLFARESAIPSPASTNIPEVSIAANIYELMPNITEAQIQEIYNNYVALMNRAREGKAIPYKTFLSLLPVYQVYKHKDTYIFGQYDVNTGTLNGRLNSAPTSKELLAEAIPNLVSKGIDFIFFVPVDYALKLQRSGFSISTNSFGYDFKGEYMQKYAAVSNPRIFEKIFNKPLDKVTPMELEEYNSSLFLKNQPVEIKGDLIKQAGNEAASILETYLNQFGIVVKDITEIKNKLNIDEVGFADLLSKIAYVKNKEDLPPVAGEFIAYMMQHNNLIKNIINELIQTNAILIPKNSYTLDINGNKIYNYKELDKTPFFKYIGKLIAEDLQNKLEGNYNKSLIDKIKDLIKTFIDYLTSTDIDKINKNIGIITNNILQQNKRLVTASLYKPGAFNKPTKQVDIEDALSKDKFGAAIIYKLAKQGFILTGSTALSEQGTILRPDENPLHDIDWVSPFSRSETTNKFIESYPDAIKVREIISTGYTTDSFLIAPEGHSVVNYNSSDFGGKIIINSYDIADEQGNIVGTYRLQKSEETGVVEEVVTGVEGKIIDFFSYEDYQSRNRYSPYDYTSEEGTVIKLANWKDIFQAKLDWARYKDIWDYNRFIPNENTPYVLEKNKNVFYQTNVDVADQNLPPEVKAKLLKFAEKLGIKIEILEDLLSNRGVNGLADIKHMIIQIQNGKEDSALAEEVAHFFVEGLDENSPLYQEMMQIIPYTRIYQEVVRQYREVYGNDTTRLKKEAMGKLIALYTSNRELAEYWAGNPSVFSAIVEWIKRFFANLKRTTKYNAFIESAERILNGDVSELSFSNKKGVYYQIADGKFTTLNNQNLAGRKLQINLNDTIFDYKGFIGPLSPAERIRVGGSSKYYQTAKLTSFALELKDKIASGSIDPKNITIYTTMEVTSVLAERLLREFGITKVVQLNKVDVFPGIDGGMIQVEVPESKEETYRQNHKDEFFIDDKPLEGVKYTIYNKRVQYVPLEIRRKRERRNEAFQAQQEELNAAFKLIERTKLQKQAEKLFALIVNSPSSLVKKIKAIEKKLETMTDEELRSVFKDDLGNVNLPTTELRQAAKLLAETDKIDKGITQFISGIRILTEFFDNINTQVKKIKSDPDNISEIQVEALIYEMMRTTKAGDVFKRYAEDLLIQLDKVEKTEAAKELISKLRTSITLAQNNIKEVSMQVLTRKLGNSLDGYEYNTQAQIKEYEEILKTNSIEYTTFLFGAKKKRPLTATERRKIDVELNKLKERKSPAEQIMNVFLGKAPAFNSLTVWVKTLENSSDPAIAAIAKMINETNQRVYVKSVQQTQDFGQQVRDYMKANGITEEMIDKNLLITEIDLIYNPDNDSYEQKERLAFLNPFKNRHIFRQKLKEVQDFRDEYMKSMEQEVNGNADLKKRYLQARAAFEKWKVENWHDEYTEEYYKRYEGIRQKYGEELYEDAVSQVNEINDSITEVKESLRQGFISYQEAHKQIKELNREKAALKLPSYPDGSAKSEKDKQIALLLQEKSEIDLEVYEYKSNYKRFVNDFMKEVISQDLSAEHREFIDAALQSKDLKGLHLYLNKNGLTDLSDWLFYNTIRKNTKEFYDDRKAITDIIDQKYSELRKLQGKEPQQSTQELWDEMFKLTKPYRDEDGHIIGSDVPDFSQNLVNEINQKLEEIRREVIKSEEEDIDNTEVKRVKKEISELFTQLSTIQSKDLTEEYVLSFEDLLSKSNYREYCDAAEIAYPENDDAIKALRNSSDFLYYIEQNKDTELGQWFFRNHYLKQQKVRVYDDFGGYVEDTVYEQTPTYIWNQITPLKDSYTEIIPGFKYSDREVISKYQTEKIEGVTFSSVTNRWLPKSSEFRNEAYFTLARTNPKLFTLLQMMTKFHLDTQVEGLSEAKLEYFVPSVEKGKLEGNVVTNTINDFLDKNNRFEEGEGNYGDGTKKSEEKRTIYRRLMDWVDTLGEEEEEEAVRLNKYTDKVEETRKKIAVPFARYMEPDQVSRDVLSTLILFRESTNRATAMKDVLNTTLLVKTILEGEPSQKERLEAVKFLEDTRIFGVNKIYELGEDADKKLGMLRKVYAFGSQSDLTGFFTNVKNNLAGRIQNFLHSEFAGWSDNKSMRKAAKYWKNNLFYYLAESEKPLQERSKDWYIQTYLNPSDMMDILMYSQPGAAKRFGSQYMLFWTKSAMEYSISVNSLYSHLFHKEVRKGTERKTLYDIIVIKDGRMTIEDGWTDSTGRPIDEEYLIRMKTMLKSILEYIQGKVGSQIKLNTTTIGAAVTFFKGWLIPNIRKRYDKKRANYVLDRDVEGYWRTFYRLSIQMIKNFKNYGELNWATFTEEERAAYRTTAKEMLIMAMTTLLITVIFGFDIDDEDKYKKLKEKSFLEQVALLVALQTKLETESLSAFPLFTTESTKDTFYLGISPILSEAPKFLTNPVFGMSMLNDATDMFKYSFKLLANTEDAYYDRDYPMYNVEEGEAKAIHNLKKILQFDDLLYTWTNPEGRLQMYINMIKR